MQVRKSLFAVAIACCGFMNGCTWTAAYGDFAVPSAKFLPPKFEKISIGASKDEVAAAIGAPDARPGASKRGDGKTVEVWEYWQYEAVPGPDRVKQKYSVLFVEDRVESWGTGADSVHEIRMK